MIFLKEEDDAVLELDTFGLLRLEVVQFGDGNLLPRLALLGGEAEKGKKGSKDGAEEENSVDIIQGQALHFVPPSFLPVAAGASVSIQASVRFEATKTWLATRRMSALVTAWR